MINFKSEAILSLAPGAIFTIIGDAIIWHDDSITQPSRENIVREVARLEYEAEIKSGYQEPRIAGYPQVEEQLDKIFHEGLDSWKEEIQAIKDNNPKVEIDPSESSSRQDSAVFSMQATDYRTATARIAQYQLSVGRPEVTESQPTGEQVFNEETGEMEDVLEEVIVQTAVEPLEPTVEITVYDEEDPMAEPTTETVPNPLIVADDAERAEAQTVIDNTPEPVKEHVDNE
jgi:hypothetical protein